MTERIEAKKQAKANIEAAQATVEQAKAKLDKWKAIAGTTERRKQQEEAESRRIAAEEAARAKAEEERLRAEREEQERIEREALGGVPDMVDDTPQDARARGYRRVSGHKVDRQEAVQGLQGKEVAVKFSNGVIPQGRVAVIESEQLQPSHIRGQRNPLHFIDEAQPKERNDEASVLAAQQIAGNIRPEEITSSSTAYTGAPTVNARGEAIQGNSRSDALRQMWESHPEQAAMYKQYLIDHAQEFGLNAEEVAAMQHPVLVNMLDVEDADAITLGQYVAQDTESGGTERIKPKNALQRMGADIRSFANLLLKSADEETSFAGLVDNNGVEVLKWMAQKGYITPTQYQSAFDSKGNLTAEAKNDLRGVLYQSIFKGGNTRLEEMFNAMPAKAQKAILATAYRDYDSPSTERMIEEIQDSIRAYHALSQDAAFMSAKNFKEARMAVENWKRQYQLDDSTGESYLPAENFSNFALLLATEYKSSTQNKVQGLFNSLYDLIQGTQEADLFTEVDNTPRTLVQAIKEVLNIDYNGQRRSNVLGGSHETGQRGRQGSTGDAQSGERVEDGERRADSAGRAESDSGQSEIGNTPSLLDVVRTLYSKGKEVASKLFSMKFFDVAQTPKFMQELGLRGDKFTIKYGVIARHLGKDSSHTLTERDWEQLPQALQNPFAISKLTDKDNSYRIYTTLQTENGEFVVVGADVKNAGREIEVNAISTVFGRRNNANLPKNEEVIYRSKEITPEQSSLLERPNSAQYPTEQELSDSKDTTNPPTTNELGEKNAEKGEKGENGEKGEAAPKSGDARSREIAPSDVMGRAEAIANRWHAEREEKRRVPLRERAKLWAKTLGVKVNLVERLDDVKNPDARRAIENGAKIAGWFEASTGEVVVYLPFNDNVKEVDKTVLHELVAHKGLRGLLGKEGFDALCDKVWAMMPAKEQERYSSYTGVRHIADEAERRRAAADEYMANLAESQKLLPEQKTIWDKIVELVRSLFGERLGKDGILAKDNLGNSDIAELLKQSYQRMAENAVEGQKGGNGGIRFRELNEEEQAIADKAKADGTYMKAPNGKQTNLTEKQWAQVRTKAFKKWFGDWEKALRIEKLRGSKAVEITFNNEYELNRDSAKQWMKDNLRGEYVNEDTGEKIAITKIGANKVTSHGERSEAHLKSIVSIPSLIEKSVFIEELPNEKGNDKYDSYRYYVCGAKIDGEDYTVKVVVGVKGDNKYYDHRLTQIEKGTLIDNLNGMANSVAENQNADVSVGKDTKLISLLQTNASKIVDENEEPLVVYHSGASNITKFSREFDKQGIGRQFWGKGFYFGTEKSKDEWSRRYEEKTGKEAEQYAVFLNVKNPHTGAIKGEVKDSGFDGVILPSVKTHEGETEPIYIVGSPSQIKSATENVGTFDEGNDDIRFRSLEETNERFNEELDAFKENRHEGLLHLGYPREVLSAAGVNASELTLSPTVLHQHLKKHDLTTDDLKGLAKAVQSPILVYKHGENKPNLVVVTELEAKGGKISVALRLDEDGSVVEVSNISSVHSKDAATEIERLSMLDSDKLKEYLRWVEKEKVSDWLGLPSEEERQDANPKLVSLAKVIESFENPKLSGGNVTRYRELNEEEQAIADKAKADGTYMKAPNGEQTNLTEKQWVQVRTKAFKKWFGDWENDADNASKIVDENGEPLVATHGTSKSFYAFDKDKQGLHDAGWLGSGFYFYTKNRQYSTGYARGGGRVMDVFLNIRNPYYATTEEFMKLAEANNRALSEEFSQDLIDNEYDGVYYDGDLNGETVAFYPNQIKSATENVGTFDEGNDDIRFRSLEETNERFNERLMELDSNPNQKDRVLRLGRPSDFLKDGGIIDAEIEMEFDKFVRKSSEKYKNNHPFTANDIKDLPKAIYSPIAVFHSTNLRDKVILTEINKGGNNFIVAVKAVQRRKKGGVILEVNEIATLYPKEAKGIVNWINSGLTTNVDKEKALHWLEALRTHHGTGPINEELDSAAKIVEEFENPKLSGGNVTRYREAKDKKEPEGQTMFREITDPKIQREVERFAARYNSAEVEELPSSREELIEMALADGYTLSEAEESYEELKNISAIYEPVDDKIYIFAGRIPAEKVEEALIHENTHRAIDKLLSEDEKIALANALYGLHPKLGDRIKRSPNYKEKDFNDEMIAYSVQMGHRKGMEAYLGELAGDKRIQDILNFINYDGGRKNRTSSEDGEEVPVLAETGNAGRPDSRREDSGRNSGVDSRQTRVASANDGRHPRRENITRKDSGLRSLIGDRLGAFLDGVLMSLPAVLRSEVNRIVPRNGWDFRGAMGDFITRVAERYARGEAEAKELAGRIREAVVEALKRMNVAVSESLSDGGLLYELWRMLRDVRPSDVLGRAEDIFMRSRLNGGNYAESAEKGDKGLKGQENQEGEKGYKGEKGRNGDVLFREVESAETKAQRHFYESQLGTMAYRWQEGFQDSMLALKRLQEAIARTGFTFIRIQFHHKATFPAIPKSRVAVAMPKALNTLLIVERVIKSY